MGEVGAGLDIVHALAPAAVGGLETVVLTLAMHQQTGGNRVSLLVSAEPRASHPFVDRARELGLPVDLIAASGRAYWAEASQQKAVLQRRAPRIVHTHGYRADLVAGGAAWWCGIPRVSTVHGFTGGDWRNRLYESLDRRVLRGFGRVVAVSELISQRLVESGISRDRVEVIPNAWAPTATAFSRSEARERLGLAADAWVIGWVGRINRVKALDVFLAALPGLSDLPLTVTVLGDGPDRAGLQGTAGDGVPIHWQGMVPDAGRYFRAFDLFVLSSRSEGTPMVGLDAMGSGVPVVATAVGGVPALFGPQAAWLVPSERPDLLGAAIREAYQDQEAARSRAATALRRVETEYTAAGWVARYQAAYQRALDRKGRQAALPSG